MYPTFLHDTVVHSIMTAMPLKNSILIQLLPSVLISPGPFRYYVSSSFLVIFAYPDVTFFHYALLPKIPPQDFVFHWTFLLFIILDPYSCIAGHDVSILHLLSGCSVSPFLCAFFKFLSS